MKRSLSILFSFSLTLAALLGVYLTVLPALPVARANNTYQALPFSQNWTNTASIATDDDWSGVPGVIGYRGDSLTGATGTDPQTILADGLTTPVDVIANQSSPITITGGVGEFEIADPVVALQGSGTADAPFILLHLDTTGWQDVTISYNVRDIDSTADNAVQPVALHYRVGTSGNFTNLPAGYIADATTGPGLATLVTPVTVTLPTAADNQPQVQLRIMTTNAVGSDEWVGIDDISVTGTLMSGANLGVVKTGPAAAQAGEAITYTINLFNTGTVTATSSVLTDTLPPEVSFVTYTTALAVNFSRPDAQTLVWDLGDVANGASGFITVQGVISSGLSTGTWLTNTVTASTTATETTFANNTSHFFTLIGELPPFTPIATARAAGPGWTGGVEGNVTVPPGTFDSRTFAVQDATGGVYVYKVSGIPALTLGDLVQVTGTLKSYNGLLEFDPTTAIVRVGPGSVPAPQVISTSAAIVSNTQGLLVRVTGIVTWTTTPPAPGTGDWSFYVNDGSGAIEIFVDKETQLDMRGYTSATQGTITGLSASYYYEPQIMPRYHSDIDIPDVTPPTVTATVPLNNASDVSLYQPLSATFSENLNPATVTTDTFTLADVNGSISGTVSYVSGTRTAIFTPASPLTPLTVHTATLTTGIQDQAGNPLAAPYLWSFTTGATDTTPPTIVDHFPAADAISVPLSSNIVITFSEDLKPSTVIPANFTLVGPSGSIGWSVFAYDAATDRLVLTPIALAVQALHTVTLSSSVTDWAGHPLSGTLSWSFATEATPEMHAFHGDIHNHTSYSDGSGTPTQALATGKTAGFDFMALTDHSYSIDDTEWANTLQAVNDATINGQFVALRGAEYTQGAEGHINVYNTVRHPCRSDVGTAYCDYVPNLEMGVTVIGFYHWLAITGTQAVDSAGSLAQFNHPGWINFNDWTYHPEVSATMKLEEVGNGNGTSYAFSEDEYIRSLDYGWKVGATNNADTHSLAWGNNTPHRTGVWMPNLTKADLMAALHARRTFATEDVNYELGLKGNGAWLGSEIPNTGSIAFEVTGFDPDGEGATLVQLISFGGQVVTQTTGTSNFTWNPIVPVTPGVHYFYVKVTQPDGDRIVTSPIWTQAEVNLAITDLSVEPTIATIYNPSLITARISNRTAATQTVTVTFQINGTPQAVLTTTVPRCLVGPCVDAYPAITWQPLATGPVTVTAIMTGAPAGDNPDDNTRTTTLNATDEKVPLVLIDAGHGNIASSPRDVRTFVNDLTAHGYNVLLNLDQITASDLNTETVKLLIINAYGPDQLTVTETQAIGNFVNAGGSLWLNGIADYAGKIAWAGNSSTILNGLVASIETSTGVTIPIRVNSDEVLDGNDNNGYPWGVLWHIFPSAFTTGIGMNVENIQSWSLCSLTDRNGQALTQSDLGANGFIVALGDEDTGTGTYGEPNRTHNENSDPTVPAFLYTAGNSVPAAAAYDIPGSAGRLFFYGDANDPFNIFAYTAGDGKQNELFNLQTVMWLLGEPITKTTIAQARAYNVVNQPDKLDQLVWIEGKITAAFGEFFNVLYVQDETGGITVHAPAGDIDATQYARGVIVRVLGTIGVYEGDTEVEFFEAEQVQILTTTGSIPAPVPFRTHAAALEQNQGWLTQITGTVTSKGADYVMVDDSSGPVRAFLDGYNGTWDDVLVSNRVTVKGLISEDGNGPRIRVRNHGMHPSIPDDVAILADGPDFSGSIATVTPTEVTGGELLTYTLIVANSGNLAGSFSLTDTLDAHVSLVSAPNMTATGSTLTATGMVASLTTQTFVITVRANDDYTGTLSNTAQLSGDGSMRALIAPNVTVSLPLAADFSGSSKLVNATIITGSQPFTYTLIISNSGTASGTFVLTDTLDTHLTLISAPGFTVDGATLTVSGTLNAPALQSFTIVVRATAAFSGTIDNTAQLSGDGQTRALIAPTVTHKPVYFTYLPLVQK